MKVLVTGAAGFIGSHLCELLLSRNYEVIGIDNEVGGCLYNLRNCLSHSNFRYIKGDLVDDSDCFAVDLDLDYVVHLAALVGVKTAIDRGVDVMLHNVKATEIALGCALARGSKLVVASSSEVYGNVDRQPLVEDQELLLPCPVEQRWSYTLGKIYDEALVLSRGGIVVRPFNTVGARQNRHYGAVLPAFVEACVNNQPMKLIDGGFQTRSFIHVLDTVSAILTVMEKGKPSEIYNVGVPDEITIAKLAEKVASVLGCESTTEKVVGGYALRGCSRRVPDVTKLTNLGWRPEHGLTEAIRDLAGEFSKYE